MNEEQTNSIESELFHRWVYEEGAYLKYLKRTDDMDWLFDDGDGHDDNIIESLPVNINVEKLVEDCISHNALISLCHSSRDLYHASRAEYLINLLINSELIPLKRVEEMQRKIYRATEDRYLEICRIDECN